LLVGQPLEVLPVTDLVLELGPRLGHRGGVAGAKPLRPFGPRRRAPALVQRPEQRVVVEPPRLLVGESAKRPRPFTGAADLGVAKPVEGPPQRHLFQAPHGGVLDALRDAHPFEPGPQLGLERTLAAERGEVLHVVEREVLADPRPSRSTTSTAMSRAAAAR
jgi:hypothetical protein